MTSLPLTERNEASATDTDAIAPIAPITPIALDALIFPLHGSRLIEASAGTGKTWTIAALYLRLVLGHGATQAFPRPLLPSEILVMTFTRAATRELSDRVRERLVDAARCFRGEADVPGSDHFLQQLLTEHPSGTVREQAAHRLMLAAETMDEAAIFTIDAWCQRMLREHAFDSGSLFDEELLADESALFGDAARDYWRQQVYPLSGATLQQVTLCWKNLPALLPSLKELVKRATLFGPQEPTSLGALIAAHQIQRQAVLAPLKAEWPARADRMQAWIAAQVAADPKIFNGNKLKLDKAIGWFDALRSWANDPDAERPDAKLFNDTAWKRLCADGILDAFSKNKSADIPADFDALPLLRATLDALEPLSHALKRHAAVSIAQRIATLKERDGQFGFADLLTRLKEALQGDNGVALRARIVAQYPVAMIDEFQDTSPDQYCIFDLLYQVAANNADSALLLIGDPKQSIYGFRGADIHSYLAARAATAGRHYVLATNFRSSHALVGAVNRLFLRAEGDAGDAGFPPGAFRFRDGLHNPLPFAPVAARGRAEHLVSSAGKVAALTFWHLEANDLDKSAYLEFFSAQCAEHIVGLLNDTAAGFQSADAFTRLQPADIAILVGTRFEAAAVRQALQQRGVASVYLSDSDSVMRSKEAADLLRWLHALANPLDDALAHAAFATGTAALSLPQLAELASDDLAWETRVEQLKQLHLVWQRQGVLAMLRRFIHELQLPARLLRETGGERRLTNLLHLAELLQVASQQLEGEQALIRWLSEQIAVESAPGDERILRLESDAALVKVVTVHKAKGLEYPLVYLPFAVSAQPVKKQNKQFFEYTDADGKHQLDLRLSDDMLALAEKARMEEALRLLYVALTRARHALWLGVAAIPRGSNGATRLAESALGYLMAGGAALAAEQVAPYLQALRGGCDDIHIDTVTPPFARTRLARMTKRLPLRDDANAVYSARFERDWQVDSFTSLTRSLGALPLAAPTRALEAHLLEGEEEGTSDEGANDNKANSAQPSPQLSPQLPPQNAPWHRFPRGTLPGLFLHEQLQWMAQEPTGFRCIEDAQFEARLTARITRAGWGHRQEDAIAWLRAIAVAPLPPLGASLCDLAATTPEMEFWFPSERLQSLALDRLSRQHLLEQVARPALPPRQLHGMLKGFIDLVFERDGRYWVLDYKSNALGPNDAAYHPAALTTAMAAHRYDIQGALYALALHRLLKSRLGAAYDPERQLGGACFLFLRGIANTTTHGCYHLATPPALLDALDVLLGNSDDITTP
ncbi:exodeoxyribonuclease V subunit beta [Herbaspirillum sp. RTI4]|uniref:exodeoxyribonuclease V subunit beta n=1 Tax=Herbaspirillum sp. RTI4 TaxID=3048640 RepID=UPI002AB3558D|nr:exodeoxyribonuclease V subunit beta [Herbaspirillum sp. RTI4]MDY7577382.1 exodeoxyribonuclease V subunit beta [Herbaspirillum sp. RTI4]MEA9982390.1 exodeoxyribonuclease V subunit beta [Herbaspirillum sp. RTI4]